MRSRLIATVIVVFWMVLVLGGCAAGPEKWNVRDAGATGNGIIFDTISIQSALDRCAARGGEVDIPEGNYLVGSLRIGGNTTLWLESGAALIGSANPDDYPITTVRNEGRWVQGRRSLLYAEHADHIRVLGPGKIVGCDAIGPLRNPRGPQLVELIACRDVVLDGFSTSYRRNWSIHPTFCQDVAIRNLTIRSNLTNGDGIDVDSCREVTIENCDIDSGDDAISLKSGRGLEALRTGAPTEDVLISHCKLGSKLFAGIGIGTEMSGGIRNVLVEHCMFSKGTNAIFIKSHTGRGGYIRHIWFEDIDADTKAFLRIDLLNKGIVDDRSVPGDEGIPEAADIGISDARVRCETLVEASNISGVKPLVGLSLLDISGICRKGIYLSNIENAEVRGVQIDGLRIFVHDVTGMGLEGAEAYTPSTEPSTRRGKTMPTTAN
jgi:polygalacturonase